MCQRVTPFWQGSKQGYVFKSWRQRKGWTEVVLKFQLCLSDTRLV